MYIYGDKISTPNQHFYHQLTLLSGQKCHLAPYSESVASSTASLKNTTFRNPPFLQRGSKSSPKLLDHHLSIIFRSRRLINSVLSRFWLLSCLSLQTRKAGRHKTQNYCFRMDKRDPTHGSRLRETLLPNPGERRKNTPKPQVCLETEAQQFAPKRQRFVNGQVFPTM